MRTRITLCMLFCLFGIIDSVSSQNVDKMAVKKQDSTSYIKQDSLLRAVQKRSCMNTFTNQNVSSYLFVSGCNTLTVQNVTVSRGGDLSLYAPSGITINGTFDVLLGGALNVGCEGPPQTRINYIYDASGNRIARQFTLTRSLGKSDITDDEELIIREEDAVKEKIME